MIDRPEHLSYPQTVIEWTRRDVRVRGADIARRLQQPQSSVGT